MKFRKFISSGLATTILLSGFNLPSFSSTLSDDGRFETFEGNNITIDNVLKEDEVDVEIEGNTMVNVANQKDAIPITKEYTVEGTNHISLQGEYDGKAKPVIEGNTMYYNNDTGELTDTFVEEANLSLVSSFEDQLVTQDMVDSGQEDAKNLGKYKVEFKSIGKNLFNINGNVNQHYNGMSVGSSDMINIIEDNKLTAILSSSYHHGKGQIIKVKPNTNYTVSLDVSENSGVITIHTTTQNNYHIKYTEGIGHREFKFNTGDNQEICLAFITHGDSTSTKAVFSNIQLEEGTTATEYEPYKESVKTLYLNSPLLEGDTIEYIDEKITHIKRYSKIVFNGDENWHIGAESAGWNQSGDSTAFHIYDNESGLVDKKMSGIAISNRLIHVEGSDLVSSPNIMAFGLGHRNYSIIRIKNSKLNSLDADGCKKWLSENPINIIYELNEPIYETISDESILIDSYKNGHLDLNTNISVNKVNFKATRINLNYLYPSTEYTVQFESDKAGKIDNVLLGNEILYSNYSINKGVNRFNITTSNEIASTELIFNGIGFNLSKLVVTAATDESFNYFEGMKSIGQDDINAHKIEIKSNNKNWFSSNLPVIVNENNSITNGVSNHYLLKGDYKIKFNYSEKTTNNSQFRYVIRDLTGNVVTGLTHSNSFSIPATGVYNISIDRTSGFNGSYTEATVLILRLNKEGDVEESLEHPPHQSNTLYIPLSEPLRSLPNGVKDKIVKKNGQWVIERNCGSYTFNGYENGWEKRSHNSEDYETYSMRDDFLDILFEYSYLDTKKNLELFSDKLLALPIVGGVSEMHKTNYECIALLSNNMERGFYINISKITLGNKTLNEWLKENNITIIFKRLTPVYEPLNISPTVNLYKDITYISNNSSIPANMKIVVDRTMNRAVEAVELAKTSPTVENLSVARMWINLLEDSSFKDELQQEVNDIFDIEDIEIEKKSVTSNMDIYVQSESMLSMSLNTSSVTFEGYSGVENIELPDAIKISINSSLPYDLNAYLETSISNKDNSNELDTDLLKIKDGDNSIYQSFISAGNKIVLAEDCASGNNLHHDIDLKLQGDDAISVDVYKTTIKFEAAQK